MGVFHVFKIAQMVPNRHVSHLLLEGSRYSKAWLPIVVARRLHASRQDIKIISLLKNYFMEKSLLVPASFFAS